MGFENPDDICSSLPVGVWRLLRGGVGVRGGGTGVADGRGSASAASMFAEIGGAEVGEGAGAEGDSGCASARPPRSPGCSPIAPVRLLNRPESNGRGPVLAAAGSGRAAAAGACSSTSLAGQPASLNCFLGGSSVRSALTKVEGPGVAGSIARAGSAGASFSTFGPKARDGSALFGSDSGEAPAPTSTDGAVTSLNFLMLSSSA